MTRALLLAALAAGCAPSPPDGTYQCGAADVCPGDLHCTCGLCVRDDGSAVCAIDVTPSASEVFEHQQLQLSLDVRGGGATAPASRFRGKVQLSASWGDVAPAEWSLEDGLQIPVTLNRETTPPEGTVITVRVAGASGASPRITVKALPFDHPGAKMVGPQVATGVTGYLNDGPSVLPDAGGYRLYISQGTFGNPNLLEMTSATGDAFVLKSSTPLPGPLSNPWAFRDGASVELLLLRRALGQGTADVVLFDDQLREQRTLLASAACGDYCSTGIATPSLIALPEGAPSPYQMYFEASDAVYLQNIGAATGDLSAPFHALASPVLAGDIVDEVLLFNPRVVLDGSVYKMWYSYARATELAKGVAYPALFCDPATTVRIGYATSSDGLLWVRSPANQTAPALQPSDDPSWELGGRSLVVGTVLPWDDAAGWRLYYGVVVVDPADPLPITCSVRALGLALASPMGPT